MKTLTSPILVFLIFVWSPQLLADSALIVNKGIVNEGTGDPNRTVSGYSLSDCDSEISVPPDMAPIPGGEFMMGDHFNEGASAERPVRRVRVHSFYMGRYEVTNRQYCDYLNSAKSKDAITVSRGVVYKADSGADYPYCDTTSSSPYSRIVWDANSFRVASDKDRHPMVKATWYGAVAYCNWRSEQEGYQQCYDLSTWDRDPSQKGYRLPTEAEWEYAARGGRNHFKYPWCSNNIDCSKANYDSCNPLALPSYPYTSPVGYYSGNANGYGLYDMTGYVWEWCNDWYSFTYYASRPDPDVNPAGPGPGDMSYRVLRGGSWNFKAKYCRVASRFGFKPGGRNYYYGVGFRPVLDLD